MNSICGLDCTQCTLKDACKGCAATGGHPFRGGCVIASCCQNRGHGHCGDCSGGDCELKEALIAEFNALGIEDMAKVTDLNALKGSYINLEYTTAAVVMDWRLMKIIFWSANTATAAQTRKSFSSGSGENDARRQNCSLFLQRSFLFVGADAHTGVKQASKNTAGRFGASCRVFFAHGL